MIVDYGGRQHKKAPDQDTKGTEAFSGSCSCILGRHVVRGEAGGRMGSDQNGNEGAIGAPDFPHLLRRTNFQA